MLYKVVVLRDKEAGVWVTDSSSVPGLVAEAATLDALIDKIELIIPDLIEVPASGAVISMKVLREIEA